MNVSQALLPMSLAVFLVASGASTSAQESPLCEALKEGIPANVSEWLASKREFVDDAAVIGWSPWDVSVVRVFRTSRAVS